MTKISIIIPVYNVEKYLGSCLDSVINQTFKDIEIICINDKSTDKSLEILNEYAEKDSRIKIIENENNIGVGLTRNKGLETVQGDYIFFIDADDRVELNACEELYNQAKNLDSEIVVYRYKRVYIETGKVTTPKPFKKVIYPYKRKSYEVEPNKNMTKEEYQNFLLVSHTYSFNKFYLREFLINNSIDFPNLRCYEDAEFNLKCFLHAKKVSYNDKILYEYRTHSQSTVQKPDYKTLTLFFETVEKMKDYLQAKGLYEQFELNLKFYKIMRVLWTYPKLNEKDKKKLLKDAKKYFNKEEYKYVENTLEPGIKYVCKRILKKIFSVENNKKTKHKQITVLGIKIKLKKKS